MNTPKTKYPQVPWVDPSFHENRVNFPLEKLAPYMGKHIAWNWDATAVVASGEDIDEVYRNAEAAGIDTQRIVLDYIGDGETFNI